MAENSKEPSKLQRQFREFSLEGDAAPAPAPKPALEPEKPVTLNPDDLKFKPFTGAEEMSAEEAEEQWYREQEAEEAQERTFAAAESFLPRRKAIRRALDEVSNLEMQAVIAAGLIEEHFRGRMTDEDVDVMTIAAITLDADNFDDMFDELPSDAVGIVDELRRAQDEEDDDARLAHLAGMEDISKTVFMAFAAADLQMTLNEMEEEDDAGPTKDDHDMLAEAIAASAEGVDRTLLRRTVNLFNDVAKETANPTRMKVTNDNKVTVQPYPDIPAEKIAKPKDPKQGKGPKF